MTRTARANRGTGGEGKRGRASRLWLVLLAYLLVSPAFSKEHQAAQRPNGAAIASQHHLATDAGHEILAHGGNAFDAAVAVSSTLSVVEPISSGLGGGGFFLLHDGKTGHEVMIDARETAPASATPAKYLDGHGELDRDKAGIFRDRRAGRCGLFPSGLGDRHLRTRLPHPRGCAENRPHGLCQPCP